MGKPMFLDHLEVHHLWFTCTARTEVRFGPQAGAQIRGALWEALQPIIGDTDLLRKFMLLTTPDGARGRTPPRPFSIRPPIEENPGADRSYPPNTQFTFGMSLFGTVIELFPYIVQAVYHIGQQGVGYGRGQFVLDGVEAVNPLTGMRQPLLEKRQITALPAVPVNAEHVAAYGNALPVDDISLNFMTPTQLRGRNKTLLSVPEFDVLIARMIERSQLIAENYALVSTPQTEWRNLHLQLKEQAQAIHMTRCDTRWINVRSGSRRANVGKKISGFVGKVTYSGPLAPFMTWLVWGQLLQVGKNTVKGNGWYVIE